MHVPNPSERPVIFLVDDDPVVIQLMGRALADLAEVRFATQATDALARIKDHPPELILLDAQLGSAHGLDVQAALRQDPLLAGIPVIFVTSHDEEALEVAALEQGAADFITKPIRPARLVARIRTHLENRRLNRQLRLLATQDGLTGVSNRRAFDDALDVHWRQAVRTGAPLAVLMFDVDCFKAYNDHHGHLAGDDCLRRVAQALQQQVLRPADLLARYGGEEFVMLLPGTPAAGAQHLAQRVLTAMDQLALPHGHSLAAPHVTVSIGVACAHPALPDQRAAWLLQAADQGLYAAKAGGRARACAAPLAPASSRP
jgi:diguanylate cyclase (GGDEF)-like protein